MNEIKWENFVNSTKENKKIDNFTNFIKILLNEKEFDKNFDEIVFKIDNLLLEMDENEQNEAKKLIMEQIKK